MVLVPVNGALARLLCKFVMILAMAFLLLWAVSQRSQSGHEFDQLARKLSFAQGQIDSLHAQVDVITKHKEKIERLLDEERRRFGRISKGQSERISRLEAENDRLGKSLTKLINQSESPIGKQNIQNRSFEENGHQIHAPLMVSRQENGLVKSKGGKLDGVVNVKQDIDEKEDVGAEKEKDDYIFERGRPREDLVFRRANASANDDIHFMPKELMRKLKTQREPGRKKEEFEENGK